MSSIFSDSYSELKANGTWNLFKPPSLPFLIQKNMGLLFAILLPTIGELIEPKGSFGTKMREFKKTLTNNIVLNIVFNKSFYAVYIRV